MDFGDFGVPKTDFLKKRCLGERGLKTKKKLKTPFENGLFEEKSCLGVRGLMTLVCLLASSMMLSTPILLSELLIWSSSAFTESPQSPQ